MGDILCTTPLIHELHFSLPDAMIDFIVDQKYQETIMHNPFLHQVIPLNRASFSGNLRRNFEFIKKIRRNKYDIVINLHRNERTTMFTAFSGGRIRAGRVKNFFYGIFFTHRFDLKGIHYADKLLSVLDSLKIPHSDNNGLEMFVDEINQVEADRMWSEAGLDGRTNVIGLNVGSNGISRRWTPSGFAQLINILINHGFVPVLFGGKIDEEIVDQVEAQISFKPIRFTGKVNLLQLAALIKKCHIFVSGDTGPLHIAASQKVPIVGIYGPTLPNNQGPYKVPYVAVTSKDKCIGCYRKKCHYEVYLNCMETISAEQVFQGINQLLKI
jgi:heptosyltransferase II